MDLGGTGDGNWFPQPAGTGFPEYTLGGIAQQLPAGVGIVTAAPKLTGMAAFSLGDGLDLSGIGGALGHFQKHPAAAVDPVAQSAEFPGGRVIPGDGADAGDALLQIHSQLGTMFRGGDFHGDVQLLAAPADTQGGGGAGGIQNFPNLVGIMHGLSVYLYDQIPDFQPGVFRLRPQRVVKGGDGHRIIPQLKPHSLSHRHQQRLCQSSRDHQKNCQHGRNCHSSHVQPSISCNFNIPQLWDCNR